jgi:hypothetical protein
MLELPAFLRERIGGGVDRLDLRLAQRRLLGFAKDLRRSQESADVARTDRRSP